ncbi:50S ribosomal protein L18 [Candidatus Babeliales bacterium]|nr:50S ribosomal protein L18 [Candidatus Babeliales bacterium]
MNIKKIQRKRQRRATRVRVALASVSHKPRVSVFRSLNHIYAQIIDDSQHKTVVASSSLTLGLHKEKAKMDKKAIAKAVGIDLAQKAIKANVVDVCFDRGSYLYHGRVQSLADGLREGGLKL